MQSALVLFTATLSFRFFIQIYAKDYPATIKKPQNRPITDSWACALYNQSFFMRGTRRK